MNGTKTRWTEVTVPHLAESLVSATIGKWLKQPGDYVEQYDIICELLTEKVNVEMPSPVAGKLTKILVDEGVTAQVGAAICVIEESIAIGEQKSNGWSETEKDDSVIAASEENQNMRYRYSPAVESLAGQHGIDLNRVSGTGLGGRITRKDILRYIDEAKANTETVEARKDGVRTSGLHLSQSPRIPSIEVESRQDGGAREYFVDVTPTRNTIASRMRQSVTEIPHAWTMIEVDVTNLVRLRSLLKEEFMRREGVNLTYLPFLFKAVVNAIKDYPIINSVWAVDKIIVKRDINISLAVGTEDSVLTPVIKKADRLNIAGLATEIDHLGKKARSGKLTLNDMQGGTFTVNNTGSFGSILSYPIINYPQAAILTFESIVKRPVIINDMIAVRSMANICLSLDHRILDGVICGRFLQRVKENLENYSPDTELY